MMGFGTSFFAVINTPHQTCLEEMHPETQPRTPSPPFSLVPLTTLVGLPPLRSDGLGAFGIGRLLWKQVVTVFIGG